jgi:hypothetical protein
LDRRSGTGRGKEVRKEGGGRNNWGNLNDELKYYNICIYNIKLKKQKGVKNTIWLLLRQRKLLLSKLKRL